MKKDEGIMSWVKSFFTKSDNKEPEDTGDDFDAAYYKGDYKATRKVEEPVMPEAEAQAPEVKVQPQTKAPTPAKVPDKADVDDFDFVDDDDVSKDYAVQKDPSDDDTSADTDLSDDGVECSPIEFVADATLKDASAIADAYLNGSFVLIDVENTPLEEKVRMFDFLSGVVYAVGGKVEKMQGGRAVVVLPEGKELDDFMKAYKALEEND